MPVAIEGRHGEVRCAGGAEAECRAGPYNHAVILGRRLTAATHRATIHPEPTAKRVRAGRKADARGRDVHKVAAAGDEVLRFRDAAAWRSRRRRVRGVARVRAVRADRGHGGRAGRFVELPVVGEGHRGRWALGVGRWALGVGR